jgi:hypothetical protein
LQINLNFDLLAKWIRLFSETLGVKHFCARIYTILGIIKLQMYFEKNTKLDSLLLFQSRVARFLIIQDTKNGKNIPDDHKIYQMAKKYTKLS